LMWMNLEVSIEEYVTFLFPYVVILLTASLKSFPLNMNIVNGSVTLLLSFHSGYHFLYLPERTSGMS